MLRSLIVAWAVNAAALWVADALFDGVVINGWKAYLIGSAVLGVVNAVLRPLLKLLTLPLVILTLGLFALLINIAMVWIAQAVTPDFSVHGFWDYVGTVIVVWLVNWAANETVDRVV